ncbi:MAG: Uma2 family endonuclease [Acidobacteria bacterium]|nr:MAG: Uma2 family endonuclease [Acidobacteriota bacterium]
MTASAPQSPHEYSFAEYLALERDSEIKHEFYAGEILEMAGGTTRHSALAMNVGFAIRGTRPEGCTVFQSDMRVRVTATGRAMYPDVSMVCGPIEHDPEDAAHTTITNPLLIVEVLSVTTEKDDRGDKWLHYQRIPSLQEYVLVGQQPRIEVFRRTPAGTWEYFEAEEGGVRLATGPTLDFSVLYADLPA